jgi:hypothetical protein
MKVSVMVLKPKCIRLTYEQFLLLYSAYMLVSSVALVLYS